MDSNVYDFKKKQKEKDPELVSLLELAADIDQVYRFYREQGLDPREIAVITAQRVSEMVRILGPDAIDVKNIIIDILNKRVQ